MQQWWLDGHALTVFEVARLLRQDMTAARPLVASLGLLLCVIRHVCPEGFIPCERCTAVHTGKGPVSCVILHMPSQVGPLTECAWAEVALEGPLACVCAHMSVHAGLFLSLVKAHPAE